MHCCSRREAVMHSHKRVATRQVSWGASDASYNSSQTHIICLLCDTLPPRRSGPQTPNFQDSWIWRKTSLFLMPMHIIHTCLCQYNITFCFLHVNNFCCKAVSSLCIRHMMSLLWLVTNLKLQTIACLCKTMNTRNFLEVVAHCVKKILGIFF